ncbi:hypothetical protein FQN57_002162 [Myotisia sp. PD_48]|nr:hypothetical protein FQN57_002162 [Myotisia sp. PD_48]
MTAMVHANLGPPTPKYQKEDPPRSILDDPSRQSLTSPPDNHQQQRLPKLSVHHDQNLQNSYSQSHLLGSGVQLHRQPPYSPTVQDTSYYNSHPSTYAVTTASGQYPTSEAPELMATAHMQPRSYPPIYHTPQTSSPASVASPQTHDQHGRSLYGQPPPMPQGMYGYPQYNPMSAMHSAPYAPHPNPPQHSQLMVNPPVSAPQMQPQPMHQQPHPGSMGSPRLKLESSLPQLTQSQRPPLNATHSSPPISNNAHNNASQAANSGAAPGPIPATTPLVVRQDTNGVQWIAFEYSRDRVKMEYTIRCDVENINIETLSPEFKTENCVYPRACCTKDQYKGNRLVYETECNAVGWALAELNPCLRGKRGLIQRAVDSWRNSHQDPRLRSRRVKRMAKANNRKAVNTQHSNHLAGPTGPPPTIPGSAPLNSTGNLTMGNGALHHHANDGSTHPDDVSGPHEYSNNSHRPPTASSAAYAPGQSLNDSRPAHVFHGYQSYPPAASANGHTGPSMAPPLRETGMDHFGKNPTVSTSRKGDFDDETSPDTTGQFRDLPEGKRRKFILVEDPQRSCRVRVKVMLDQVDMKEIPDSYRKSNSVFPRTYFPVHSPFGQSRSGGRFTDDANEQDDGSSPTLGRTLVPAPMLEGEGTVAVPRLSRRKRDKETILNDMGYRMSWGQSRVFAGRTLFLQRASMYTTSQFPLAYNKDIANASFLVDAYRNKMRNSMLTAGHETTEIAPHFETRVGKRKWLERSKRASSIDGAGSPAVNTSASSRSAEEVEP